MFLKYITGMILWLLFLGTVISAPADEFLGQVHQGELALNDETHIKYIVPSGYVPQKLQKPTKILLTEYVDKDNENYKLLERHIDEGHTAKGLTFNIYDDNMREATIALFRILQYAEEDKIPLIKEWAIQNIHKDMLDYAQRLVSLYRNDIITEQEPPFVTQPNLFINSEAIHKAFKLKVKNGKFDQQEAKTLQFYRTDNVVTINTNYSGWNSLNKACQDKIDYFREDIGINSYYYGIHLLFPFWMSNDELTGTDPKYARQYYFVHRQLLARYKLEKEHLKSLNVSSELDNCYDDFVPYLSYENGLAFPPRSSIRGAWNDDYARIKAIDIAIKECITRSVIFMDNGTKVALNEENYVDLLSKLIRANFDGVKVAKNIRSLFGYGGDGYPVDGYNPAPSVLHHPQTTLRDPVYWYMIQNMLHYFTEYSNTLEPYDFSKYQTENINIIDISFSKITTYYEYYQINLNKIFDNANHELQSLPLVFTARQKRLKHLPITFAFTVDSKLNVTSLVKLFLGPECEGNSCWDKYSRFYELDAFTHTLEEGINLVKWSPESSGRFSVDDYYNMELKSVKTNKYDLFQFPENLLIPKGLDNGLNLTLFVLITAIDDISDLDYISEPLGFPFHRQTLINNSTDFNNYKFYTIPIYHKESTNDKSGYFSPHLN